MIARICEYCGSPFRVRAHKVREGKGRFCSRRCYHAARPVRAMPYRQVTGARYEHRRVAERALGKPLPKGACVHHANENTLDNTPSNLVICQDAAYHRLLHQRARIIKAGGDPAVHRVCGECGGVFHISRMSRHVCKPCGAAQKRAWLKRRATQCSEVTQ